MISLVVIAAAATSCLIMNDPQMQPVLAVENGFKL